MELIIESPFEYVLIANCMGFILLVCEVLFRFFTVVTEFILEKNHYMKNRFTTILKYSFTFNWPTIILFISFIIIFSITFEISKKLVLNLWILIFLVPFYILFRYNNFTYSYVEQAKWIRSGSGLDYATGMASNYFHGYLFLALPDKGDEIKGIIERMKDYEDREGIIIPVKKLFILIPDNSHIKPIIDSPLLELAKPLEEINKNRAGVRRPFKNAVYKFIKYNYYVVVEGATPLLSFYEAVINGTTGTADMKAMQREIQLQFYKALKTILYNCPDTRDLCELIYYCDLKSDGTRNDVGEHILARLKALNPEIDI